MPKLPSTSSQVYLALDIVNSVRRPERGVASAANATAAKVWDVAVAVLLDAMSEDNWTGKSADCPEYGRPPSAVDPAAQVAMRALGRISAVVESGGVVTADTVRALVQEASDEVGGALGKE